MDQVVDAAVATPMPGKCLRGESSARPLPSQEVLEDYIQEDLQALEDPLRQDETLILRDLRHLFRSYWHSPKDWSPV